MIKVFISKWKDMTKTIGFCQVKRPKVTEKWNYFLTYEMTNIRNFSDYITKPLRIISPDSIAVLKLRDICKEPVPM